MSIVSEDKNSMLLLQVVCGCPAPVRPWHSSSRHSASVSSTLALSSSESPTYTPLPPSLPLLSSPTTPAFWNKTDKSYLISPQDLLHIITLHSCLPIVLKCPPYAKSYHIAPYHFPHSRFHYAKASFLPKTVDVHPQHSCIFWLLQMGGDSKRPRDDRVDSVVDSELPKRQFQSKQHILVLFEVIRWFQSF